MTVVARRILLEAVKQRLATEERIVLAVSGGMDSMALLDAAARVAPDCVTAVATFDHGTGEHARRASRSVAREAKARGFVVVRGRAKRGSLHGEAAWREARWRFLRAVAAERAARVATAHTRDDQLETIILRTLRGAGARGLAGLDADGDVLRPLLGVARADVAAYVTDAGVPFGDDPTNVSRAHLRNRVRHDLLPALARQSATFADDILAIGARAAAWRRDIEALVAELPMTRADGELTVPARALSGFDAEALAVLVPPLAALAGITLDRRGTDRLAKFILHSRTGAVIQLSGFREAVRGSDSFVLRRTPVRDSTTEALLSRTLEFGAWRFRLSDDAGAGDSSLRGNDDLWSARLPREGYVTVRLWQPGDRVIRFEGRAPRRVKRFLREAGVGRADRRMWPVVLVNARIVWIPGVLLGRIPLQDAAEGTDRYVCERIG